MISTLGGLLGKVLELSKGNEIPFRISTEYCRINYFDDFRDPVFTLREIGATFFSSKVRLWRLQESGRLELMVSLRIWDDTLLIV